MKKGYDVALKNICLQLKLCDTQRIYSVLPVSDKRKTLWNSLHFINLDVSGIYLMILEFYNCDSFIDTYILKSFVWLSGVISRTAKPISKAIAWKWLYSLGSNINDILCRCH